MSDYKAIIKLFEDPQAEKRSEGDKKLIGYIKNLTKTGQKDTLTVVYEYLCDQFEKQLAGGNSFGCLNAFTAFSLGIKGDRDAEKRFLPSILVNLANGYRNGFSLDANRKTKKKVVGNLMNVVGISKELIAPCLKKLLEIVFVMMKDIDTDINTFGGDFDNILKGIIKNADDAVLNIDIAGCLEFMCRNIRLDKSNIKTWIISWFSILLTIPKLNLTQNLPIFFKEIIHMVGKQKNEVNRSVEKFLNDLRTNFKQSCYIESRSFCFKILRSLTEIFSVERNRRKLLEIFKWIYDILRVQFKQVNTQLIENPDTKDKMFENIISEILLFILECLKDEDDEIKDAALKINNLLQEKIMNIITYRKTNHEEMEEDDRLIPEDNSAFPQIFEYLKTMISNNSNFKTVYYAMKWIEHLLDYFPQELMELSHQIIENLQHRNIQIVEISVILIAKCVNKQENYNMISQILDFIENSLQSSEDQSKILSILKILFHYIEGQKIMLYFAESLNKSFNKQFKIRMVQSLDMVINIEESLESYRVKLRTPGEELFEKLFQVWAVEPISAISLCLMSQKFKLANKIVQILSVSQINMDMLVHLSKIVRLIDMPHYAYLRMQLLYPQRFPYLVNTLKGILMLLPQGKAFEALKNRLECSSLLMGLGDTSTKVFEEEEDIDKFVQIFMHENESMFPKAYSTFLAKLA